MKMSDNQYTYKQAVAGNQKSRRELLLTWLGLRPLFQYKHA